MMYLLAILALLGAAFTQDNSKDLDAALKSIFGPGIITDGTSQNAGGTSENTGDTGENESGTRQDTAVIESVLGPSTEPDLDSIIDSVFRPENSTATSQNNTASANASCKTVYDEVGECVRYYLCEAPYTSADHIDIHVPIEDPCPSYLDVCCPKKNRITRAIADTTTLPATLQPQREGCGYSNPNGVDRGVSGAADGEAKFGEFPWVVAILKSDSVSENGLEGQKLNNYIGSGSLIHPNVVLTAAHNVAAVGPLRVRAGEWDTQTTEELYPYQERDVAKIAIHKDFNKGNMFYDIAVLFLSAPMELAPNVGVVCLPPSRERAQGGTRCFSSGWGKDGFSKNGLDKVTLNKVEVPVVERRPCLESLRKSRLGGLFELHTSFMCAGEPGHDVCRRDGGAPLVCPIEFEEDRYMQSGIAAWHIGCGEGGTPGVYVDVANLRAWIDDQVKGQGYLINGYSYTV